MLLVYAASSSVLMSVFFLINVRVMLLSVCLYITVYRMTSLTHLTVCAVAAINGSDSGLASDSVSHPAV